MIASVLYGRRVKYNCIYGGARWWIMDVDAKRNPNDVACVMHLSGRSKTTVVPPAKVFTQKVQGKGFRRCE